MKREIKRTLGKKKNLNACDAKFVAAARRPIVSARAWPIYDGLTRHDIWHSGGTTHEKKSSYVLAFAS
jgi:hypothetical protein